MKMSSIDFIEIFSPIVKINNEKVLLTLVATKDLELEQLNVWNYFPPW